MSTPAEQAATLGSADSQQSQGSGDLSFDQKVNQAIDSAALDEKGNIVLPDDLSEDIAFAARAEKRRRDTQSALAKANSRLSVVEAENEGLTTLVMEGKRVTIPDDQAEELEELKHSQPDEWRKKMNELEQAADNEVKSKITNISETAKSKASVGERQVLLDAFQADNPELTITDDVLANDIPPRITRALENGDISFMDFLGKVKEYLTTDKVIEDTNVDETPNLSELGGSDKPGDKASGQQSETDYEKMIF